MLNVSNGDVLQILPPHHWGTCLVSVERVFSDRILVCLAAPDDVYVRRYFTIVKDGEFVPVGAKAWIAPRGDVCWANDAAFFKETELT